MHHGEARNRPCWKAGKSSQSGRVLEHIRSHSSPVHLMTMMRTAEQYLHSETAMKVEESVHKSFEKADGVYEAMDMAVCSTMINSPCAVLERRLLRRVLCPLVLALEGELKLDTQSSEAAAGLGMLQTRYISERFRWSWSP